MVWWRRVVEPGGESGETAPVAQPAPPDDAATGPDPEPQTPEPAPAADPPTSDDRDTDPPPDVQDDRRTTHIDEEVDVDMADYNEALNEAMNIEGALGVALVDSQSGMALATAGNPPNLDLNVAAAGNSSVVQAKLRTMKDLGLTESIEDILITLDTQYHLIRTFGKHEGMFLYLVLDKGRSNLAMARFRLARIEGDLQL